ncbi:hypothetical protein [Sandaracinus amylolyticus]|uniref:hypothetical protein n=1 Tax=Sandaracinus amylolyticus TaxID=927083 RepID=UPI001F18C6E6|nr:hypothetical protein [Sandaracinus amylolyticus]UJR78673.1 Hypothetical protein I5071_7040 [Sandaracinus amylolyticus]
MTPKHEGPYRTSARGDADSAPPQRGVEKIVTWAGAILVLGILVVVGEAATRGWRAEGALAEARDVFAETLRDPSIVRLAVHADPRSLVMPAPPELDVAEQADLGYVAHSEHDRELPQGARGLLLRAGSRPRFDAAHVGLARLAASSPDEVRWVGIVAREMLHDRYTYGAVSVDVERARIAIVDVESGEVAARITVEAAPPARTQSAREVYRLSPTQIGEAITEALDD